MSNATSAPSNATALPDGWEMVVGLEVHVELDTATKLFSGSPNRFGDDPNTHIDPVTLGLPGALPVLNRKTEPDGQFHRLAVEHGQCTWQAKCDGIDVRVGIIAKTVWTTRKQLGGSVELDMHLETHHHLPTVGQGSGIRRCARCVAHRARSNSAATRNIVASPRAGASTCTPTGRPWAPVP